MGGLSWEPAAGPSLVKKLCTDMSTEAEGGRDRVTDRAEGILPWVLSVDLSRACAEVSLSSYSRG